MTCERCGKPGRRSIGRVAPEGWFFGSFTLGSDGDHDPGELLIVHACSAECRDALWTRMDGHRWDEIDRRVDVREELRRVARLHAARLRGEADRLRTAAFPCGAEGNPTASSIFAKILSDIADELQHSVETTIDGIAEAESGGAS